MLVRRCSSCASQEGHQLLRRRSQRPFVYRWSSGAGGGAHAVAIGKAWLAETLDGLQTTPRVPFSIADLTIGTICGGSDSTSALSANPGIGLAYDRLIAEGATAIFEETGELIGCDHLMAARATTPAVAKAILAAMARGCDTSMSLVTAPSRPGTRKGAYDHRGEILGAYAKSGSGPVRA
jgi:altronate hydrolase